MGFRRGTKEVCCMENGNRWALNKLMTMLSEPASMSFYDIIDE